MKPRYYWVGSLMIIVLWTILTLLIDTTKIPSPWSVGLYLATHKDIWLHLGMTLVRLLAAIVLSYLFGGLLGLWMATSKNARRYLLPVVQVLFAMPRLVLFPLFYLSITSGFMAQVTAIVFVTLFYVTIPTYESLIALPETYVFIARSLDFSTGMWVRYVAFPAVVPRLILMAQQTLGLSLSLILITEQFRTSWGIGKFLVTEYQATHYLEVYASILLLTLLGIIGGFVCDILKVRFSKWFIPLAPFA